MVVIMVLVSMATEVEVKRLQLILDIQRDSAPQLYNEGKLSGLLSQVEALMKTFHDLQEVFFKYSITNVL